MLANSTKIRIFLYKIGPFDHSSFFPSIYYSSPVRMASNSEVGKVVLTRPEQWDNYLFVVKTMAGEAWDDMDPNLDVEPSLPSKPIVPKIQEASVVATPAKTVLKDLSLAEQ